MNIQHFTFTVFVQYISLLYPVLSPLTELGSLGHTPPPYPPLLTQLE